MRYAVNEYAIESPNHACVLHTHDAVVHRWQASVACAIHHGIISEAVNALNTRIEIIADA